MCCSFSLVFPLAVFLVFCLSCLLFLPKALRVYPTSPPSLRVSPHFFFPFPRLTLGSWSPPSLRSILPADPPLFSRFTLLFTAFASVVLIEPGSVSSPPPSCCATFVLSSRFFPWGHFARLEFPSPSVRAPSPLPYHLSPRLMPITPDPRPPGQFMAFAFLAPFHLWCYPFSGSHLPPILLGAPPSGALLASIASLSCLWLSLCPPSDTLGFSVAVLFFSYSLSPGFCLFFLGLSVDGLGSPPSHFGRPLVPVSLSLQLPQVFLSPWPLHWLG